MCVCACVRTFNIDAILFVRVRTYLAWELDEQCFLPDVGRVLEQLGLFDMGCKSLKLISEICFSKSLCSRGCVGQVERAAGGVVDDVQVLRRWSSCMISNCDEA